METSLHRALKERFGTLNGGRCEVAVNGFRIDAVAEDGALIEIQSGSLGALKPKLKSLLPSHRVRVVRPMVLQRTIVRRDRLDGPDLSRRRSPKRGVLDDVFDDLVGLASLLSDPNLTVELLGVAVEEIRAAGRPRHRRGRGRGHVVLDRRLDSILASETIARGVDLWNLLPLEFPRFEPFTTADLARKLGRPLFFAQRVAYCLRLAGAARMVGKRGNSLIYRSTEDVALVT